MYQKMYQFMERNEEEVMVGSNKEGMEKVIMEQGTSLQINYKITVKIFIT